MAESCEHCDESSGSIKGKKFLRKLLSVSWEEFCYMKLVIQSG
jgi:hypothetical protein